MLSAKLAVADGVNLWRSAIDAATQFALVQTIFSQTENAPFYTPVMPRTGKSFSVRETNFGSLGWIADIHGYRYSPKHPQTGVSWPSIPQELLAIWSEATRCPLPPQCCLVNLYRGNAKMGLHQDCDETALQVPVLSVSLGDDALFRVGGTSRSGATRSVRLKSGDILTFGGPARLAFHGIDRIYPETSSLVPGGGRINLTLRRVTP